MTELRRDLLLHPIRIRIVQALTGTPMTPLELKERLGDVAQATLYRHLHQLEEGGLLEVVDEQRVRGVVERTYGVVASAVRLDMSDLHDATAGDHFRYFATFLGALLTDYTSYLETSDLDLEADRVGFRQVPVWLSDEEFDSMLEEMRRPLLERLDNRPAPGRRRRLVTTIVMPDDRT